MSKMSRAITGLIIAMAGAFVGNATKNLYAGCGVTLILLSLDCILQDAVRKLRKD
jgi:hypothetical protein